MATVRIEGLNTVLRQLKLLGLTLDDLRPAFTYLSDRAAAYARADAPKRTGRMAGSVRGSQGANKAAVFAGGGGVLYAGVQNY